MCSICECNIIVALLDHKIQYQSVYHIDAFLFCAALSIFNSCRSCFAAAIGVGLSLWHVHCTYAASKNFRTLPKGNGNEVERVYRLHHAFNEDVKNWHPSVEKKVTAGPSSSVRPACISMCCFDHPKYDADVVIISCV